MSPPSAWQYVFKTFVSFAKEHPWLVALNAVFLLLIPADTLLLPSLYGNVISEIQSRGNGLAKAMAVLVIALIIVKLAIWLSEWHDAHLYPKLAAHVRKRIFAEMLRDSVPTEDVATGKIVSNLIKLPHATTHLLEKWQMVILPKLLTLLVASIYIGIRADVFLGMMLLVLTCVVCLVMFSAPKLCYVHSQKAETIFDGIQDQVDDVFRNLVSVHESGQTQNETVNMHSREDELKEYIGKPFTCSLRIKAILMPCIFLLIIVFGIRSYLAFKTNRMNVATFVVVFIIVMEALSSLLVLTDQLKDLVDNLGVLQTFLETKLFENNQKKDDVPSNPRLPNFKSCIEIRNVSYAYPDNKNRLVLRNVNLKVCPGDRIAIIGKVGCGKSTLLRIVSKFLRPSSGEVYWDNIPYSEIPTTALRSAIGLLPQSPMLFNRTIFDNVSYGNPSITKEKVTSMIKELGIGELLNRPGGLDFRVGKNGSRLSGGQRCIVWCLRVLMADPKVLVMDEPTSALDGESKKKLTTLLERAMRGRTVLMVTHDKDLMQYADKTVDVCS
jgi:ABC-type multidrug transport system fused ATPase/permease subunit